MCWFTAGAARLSSLLLLYMDGASIKMTLGTAAISIPACLCLVHAACSLQEHVFVRASVGDVGGYASTCM